MTKIPETSKVFILLAAIIWIAYFWHYPNFGLYSDDFMRVGGAMEFTWSELWRLLLDLLVMKHGEGRPIHDGLIYLLSFLGLKLGGVSVIYLIVYCLFTLNTFLFYILLKRLFNKPIFALTGTLAFCLFPAHTTQLWLTVALGTQPSLMLLLLAIHLYLSHQKKLSYFFIFSSLFGYETFFPVFLAAPLLNQKWNSKLFRELVKHALILGIMMIVVIMLRKFAGENRVAELNILAAITKSISHMFLGPITIIKIFLSRPLEVVKELIGKDSYQELWLFLPPCFAGLVYIFSRLKLAISHHERHWVMMFESRVLRLETPEFFKPLIKLALAGLMMLILAYPLTLIGSATVVNNFISRIHLAAVIGASLLFACVCSALFFLAKTYRKHTLIIVGLSVYFTLLIGFGLCVQRDYQLAWQYQKAYWSDVIKLIPDLAQETVLIQDVTGLKNPTSIASLASLHPSTVLSSLYQFPEDWKDPAPSFGLRSRPIWTGAHMLEPNWWQSKIILLGEDLLQFDPLIIRKEDTTTQSSNIILLEVQDGKLTRRTEPLIIQGQTFPLKIPSTSNFSAFQKGPLYNYLIQSPEEELINYKDQGYTEENPSPFSS